MHHLCDPRLTTLKRQVLIVGLMGTILSCGTEERFVPGAALTGFSAAIRFSHTATLLADGRVVVAGGNNSTGPLEIVELFDPVSATFSVAGSLSTARFGHTATVLRDGRVLIAGGTERFVNTGALFWELTFLEETASAEIFDPVSRTITPVSSLNISRSRHTATLLDDGKVLITGGTHGFATLSEAELFDPSTGSFTLTGAMALPRVTHTATFLPDGRVLIAGGYSGSMSNGTFSDTAEIYVPATENFVQTGSMAAHRGSHIAAPLPGGRVLVAGGRSDHRYEDSAEIFNPNTSSFTATGRMSAEQSRAAGVVLPDGRVLISGGTDEQGVVKDTVEIFDPADGRFTVAPHMRLPRFSHTATRLHNGRILFIGGRTSGAGGNLGNEEIYAVPD